MARAFVRSTKKAIHEWSCAGMFRTDVENYYPSVKLDLLRELALTTGVEPAAVHLVIDAFERWEVDAQTTGIPIGPDAASILGTFLHPLDRIVGRRVERAFRYTDDMAHLYGARLGPVGWYDTIDEGLSGLGLKRSEQKTAHAGDREEARHLMDRSDLGYVDAFARGISGVTIAGVQAYYEEHFGDAEAVDGPALRACLRAFKSAKSDYAVASLLANRALFAADPQSVAGYFCALPPDPALGTALFDLLAVYAHEAVRLHILRSCLHHGLPSERSTCALSLAAVSADPEPVQGWAVMVGDRNRKISDVVDVARLRGSVRMRRAAILALRPIESKHAREATAAIAGHDAEAGLTLRWATAA